VPTMMKLCLTCCFVGLQKIGNGWPTPHSS
jgi:hypothetical protein